MTDLTPNDLSHLSDEKFNALCPQGFHGTGDFEPDNLTPEEHERLLLMSEHGIGKPLSPAARAVFEAFNRKFEWIEDGVPGPQFHAIAAALRAVADEVVPDMDEPESGAYNEMHCDIELFTDHQRKRATIIAIATELEDHQ
jgi:hypothetical protein